MPKTNPKILRQLQATLDAERVDSIAEIKRLRARVEELECAKPSAPKPLQDLARASPFSSDALTGALQKLGAALREEDHYAASCLFAGAVRLSLEDCSIYLRNQVRKGEELSPQAEHSKSEHVPVPRSECPAETVVESIGQPRPHTWQVFRESGMLWVANRALHVFGWAIVVCQDDNTDEVVDVYPARTTWRGFSSFAESRGFARVSAWMAKAAPSLCLETNSERLGVKSRPFDAKQDPPSPDATSLGDTDIGR